MDDEWYSINGQYSGFGGSRRFVIGNVKFRGIGLGIGGVLFGGIIVGHFVSQAGMDIK